MALKKSLPFSISRKSCVRSPEHKSNPNGFTFFIASFTLEGLIPPASKTGIDLVPSEKTGQIYFSTTIFLYNSLLTLSLLLLRFFLYIVH